MALCARNVINNLRIFTLFNSKRIIRNKFNERLQMNTVLCYLTNNFHMTQSFCKKKSSATALNQLQYPPKSQGEIVDVWRNITVTELADILKCDINTVYDLFLGNIKGRHTAIVDIKELQNAIRRNGKRMRIIARPVDKEEEVEEKDVFPRPPPNKSDLKPRPPIVTVMGHVDHGKTTLLDALRHSSVVDQEFGGITQHIGAFSVKLESGAEVTFLDTPGHAAFTAMRARGANVTDVVVLVVAADDGVMEQTVESIRMARRAKVPILVAINKIDAPKADIEQAEQMLMQVGIQVENLGGDVQAVHISALKRINLDQLTEALVLQAELLEIGGDPTGLVEAVVVESRIDQHRGRLCTIVVQRGTLKKGDVLVADTAMAKVRVLRDSTGKELDHVEPGYPAEVEGWKNLPPAGSLVLEVDSEKKARDVIKFRETKRHAEKLEEDANVIAAKREEHDKIYRERLQLKRQMGRFKMRPDGPRKPEIAEDSNEPFINVIIKADVDGTLEAILEVLSTYNSAKCKMDIVGYGIGAVTENDIELAEAFKGIIYAFNVGCPNRLQQLANDGEVLIKHHNVIYKLIDDFKEDINKRLPSKQVEDVLGEAKVLQQFLVSEGRKKIPVAGCHCEKGVLRKGSKFKVVRNNETIYEGKLSSMRYLKDEVETIKGGSDCGLQFADRSILFEPGDAIICYEHKMETQTTDWDPGF